MERPHTGEVLVGDKEWFSMDMDIGWLVVGAGRAGNTRARDIQTLPGHRLVAHLPGRSAHGDILSVLRDPAVGAVAVCTSNDTHERLARAALDARKHVLVEFPLCLSERAARTLFALAAARRRVLHVEYIGLLTAAHGQRRERVSAGDVESVEVEFSGGLYRWVAHEVSQGRVGQLAIGRLQALLDLFSVMRVSRVQCQPWKDGYELNVSLSAATGESIRLVERRATDVARGASWRMNGAPVQTASSSPVPGPSLFARDLLHMEREIRGHAACNYVQPDAVLAAQRLADIISAEAHWRS